MAIEIERKFLVKSSAYRDLAHQNLKIIQGFLNSHKKRVVRIRLMGEKAYLTIKGKSTKQGLARFEWEKEIPVADALDLLKLAELPLIEKTRYFVHYKEHLIEVDEFYGENEGLIVAEIELKQLDEKPVLPQWLGKEVTGKKKYYNAQLIIKPYREWKKKPQN